MDSLGQEFSEIQTMVKKKFVVKTKACEMEISWSISFYGGLNCLLF